MLDVESTQDSKSAFKRGAAMDFQVSAADVKISAMTASATRIPDRVEVTTTITIHSDNDDSAPNVQCIVVLPPTSRVVSSNPAAVIGPAFGALGPASQFIQSEPTNGYVIFELRDPMDVNDEVELTLVTHVHDSWAERPIAAFVSSDAPDPNPANNCRSAQAALPVGSYSAAHGRREG
jgi:hypothetical protein